MATFVSADKDWHVFYGFSHQGPMGGLLLPSVIYLFFVRFYDSFDISQTFGVFLILYNIIVFAFFQFFFSWIYRYEVLNPLPFSSGMSCVLSIDELEGKAWILPNF